jgi:PhzF family phenazine biosynthesis protein
MMRKAKNLLYFHVDAFTRVPFKGNPAGVCLLSEPAPDHWMQSVAHEVNLSETAFVEKRSDGFSLRWFSPKVEVDLCGHATLASAHVLWETGAVKSEEPARFHTRSGLLTAVQKDGWTELDFPSQPDEEVTAPSGLIRAIGATPQYVGKNRFDFLIEVKSEEILRNLEPNFELLSRFPVRGFIVTSRSDGGEFDFVSRFFCPRVGILEDPVTGSACCCLGPYWQRRLGKDEFVAFQASQRGGVIRVKVKRKRVLISGQAVTVSRGEVLVERV